MTGSPTVTLRRTTLADFAHLRRPFDHPSFHGWGGSTRLPDDQIRAKYLGTRHPDVECFLIVRNTEHVGRVQLHVADRGNGGGMDLILLPEARGQGIGRVVVAEMVRRARDDRGWQRFTVDPDVDNESGVRFWQAVGFRPERVVSEQPARAPYLLMAWPE